MVVQCKNGTRVANDRPTQLLNKLTMSLLLQKFIVVFKLCRYLSSLVASLTWSNAWNTVVTKLDPCGKELPACRGTWLITTPKPLARRPRNKCHTLAPIQRHVTHNLDVSSLFFLFPYDILLVVVCVCVWVSGFSKLQDTAPNTLLFSLYACHASFMQIIRVTLISYQGTTFQDFSGNNGTTISNERLQYYYTATKVALLQHCL